MAVESRHEPFVKNAFSGQIGGAGGIFCFVDAKANRSPFDGNASAPPSLMSANSSRAGRIINPGARNVLNIDSLRNISQIINPVISTNPILVVDTEGRPNPVHIEPCESMGKISAGIDTDSKIAGQSTRFDYKISPVASLVSLCRPNLSCEKASLSVVMKKFMQAFNRKFFFHSGIMT